MSVVLNGIGNQSHCISKEWQAGEMNRRSAVVVFTVSTIKLKNISKQEVHIVNKASMKTILLIEDTSDILENLTEYLEMEGYSVLVANNGKKGIELAVEFTPDLIICDVLMQIMDGYEVLRLLLNIANTHDIPFIFSTSMSEEFDRTESLNLGADDYIHPRQGIYNKGIVLPQYKR